MAATVMLIAHIVAGAAGLATGAVALAAPKGAPLHRVAGTLFFAAMLVMTGLGTIIAAAQREPMAFVPGVVTFYLVATGWAAVKRPAGQAGRFEAGAALAGGLAAATGLALALTNPAVGVILMVFAGLAGFAAWQDIRVVRSGGVAGPARIARHLWRLCAALAIAAFSFFLGQQDEFPTALRGPQDAIPALVVLGAMIFWLVRLRAPAGRAYSAAKARPDHSHQRWAR